ncbi:hypothetical protein QYM36_011375 [Artemia franciscana]|uniref:Uncharacterized protein n=2 Tax=Artemia franciscana TaxID=6661 RepID=A0AA88HXA4_ARTSF|nr:hypothetical protein QYM36_011375 [Artemia franciscana]
MWFSIVVTLVTGAPTEQTLTRVQDVNSSTVHDKQQISQKPPESISYGGQKRDPFEKKATVEEDLHSGETLFVYTDVLYEHPTYLYSDPYSSPYWG